MRVPTPGAEGSAPHSNFQPILRGRALMRCQPVIPIPDFILISAYDAMLGAGLSYRREKLSFGTAQQTEQGFGTV